MTKYELKQLFNFAASATHFIFDGSFYDKIDGVSIGSPSVHGLSREKMVARIWQRKGSRV